MCCRTSCSFTNRPDILKTVNALLEKRYSAKKIEGLTGIGHSIVGRHHLHCFVKSRAELIRKERQFDPSRRKIIVQWPGQVIAASEIDHDTVVLRVLYEHGFIGNPHGLTHNGAWNEAAQKSFLDRVTPNVKRSYIDGIHEDALAENAEFDFARDPKLKKLDAQLSANENVTPD